MNYEMKNKRIDICLEKSCKMYLLNITFFGSMILIMVRFTLRKYTRFIDRIVFYILFNLY